MDYGQDKRDILNSFGMLWGKKNWKLIIKEMNIQGK